MAKSVWFALLSGIGLIFYLKHLGRRNLKKKLIPWISYFLLNPSALNLRFRIIEWINYFRHRQHRVLLFYHDVYDPHSIAMLHAVPLLMAHYDIEIVPKLVTNKEIKVFGPKSNAFNLFDASLQCKYYQIPITLPLSEDHLYDKGSKQKLYDLSNAILATAISKKMAIERFVEIALKISKVLWDQTRSLEQKYNALQSIHFVDDIVDSKVTEQVILDGNNSLQSNGHYLSGNIYFNGECFPRIDRMHFLIRRLSGYRRDQQVDLLSIRNQPIKLDGNQMTLKDPFKMPSAVKGKVVNLWWSFRSPYSYLILPRIYKLCDDHELKLNILPVMPSIFRKVPISNLKSDYIPMDCVRIAEELGMPYGSIFDVGVDIKMVELCLKLFMFAEHSGREREYTLTMATAIWAHGVDIENEQNINRILKECSLGSDLKEYKEFEGQHLMENQHIEMTERNLEALHETGNWGVPSVEIDGVCVWGQDRLWAFDEVMIDNKE